MREFTDFDRADLSNAVAVGAVTVGHARVWARVSGPGPLEVELAPAADPGAPLARGAVSGPRGDGADGTCTFVVPDDLAPPGAGQPAPLAPGVRYRVAVRRAGAPVGVAYFDTPPAPGGPLAPLAFAFGSCHQPFDEDGALRPASARMLAATRRALRARDAKFVLLLGDQIYADHPPGYSLFDEAYFARVAPPDRTHPLACTAAEARSLYQRRHRAFVGVEEFAGLLADAATYPILDDHELVDNFGADPAHAGPEWAALRAGALEAFYDYQAARVVGPGGPPPDFHYGFAFGGCAVFVMDVRSGKRRLGEETWPYDGAQLDALASFLAEHAAAPVLALAVSVPLVYVESWLVDAAAAVAGDGSDVGDRWNHHRTRPARDRLLALVRAHQALHPAQRLILLSGDIHVGCAFRIDWDDSGPPLLQFTSSALSNEQGVVMSNLAELAAHSISRLEIRGGPAGDVRLLEGVGGALRNPYGGLNAGVVHVRPAPGGAEIEFELLGFDEATGEATAVFRSGWL